MADAQTLVFGPYRLDPANARLWRETALVRLTPKAFDVLCYVAARPGQLVSKDELFDAVWCDTVISDATLTSAIQEIRKALQDNPREPQYLETVLKRGFRFIGTVVSDQLSVVSEEEGDRRKESGVRRSEQTTNEQEVIQAIQPEALSESPWIPASAGMTPLPSFPQNDINGGKEPAFSSRLSPPAQALNAATLPTHRSWSARTLSVLGLVLFVGVIIVVQYRSLLLPSPQSPASSPQLPLSDKPSLVVLPLVNLSGDPAQEYFSDGLTEVLTGALSRISSLFIIARNSAFTYKGKAVKVQEVSKEMGVRYVLEGSVQKTTQRVRINVQLIDATTGYHIWSEQYDRPLTDIFALQDEILQRIVTTLKLQLTLEEQGYIIRKHTDNLEAYDTFLRGVESYNRTTKEANAQARLLFEKAVTLDPQYAEAYAYQGWTYWLEWGLRWSADPQTLERAFALARQAVALDDSLPTAHSVLSNVYTWKQQYNEGRTEAERAIALDPNNADSYASAAQTLNNGGHPEETLRMMAQAMRLNPHYPVWYLWEVSFAYHFTGRYAEEITTLQEIAHRNPNFGLAYVILGATYTRQWISQLTSDTQTLELALAAVQRSMALNASLQWNPIVLSYIYLDQHQYEQALAEAEQSVAIAPTLAESYATLADVLSRAGRSKEALEAAAQAQHLQPEVADGHLDGVGAAYAVVGHYEEAQAVLQRYLSRYPNFLPSHLMLAAVYSELGQTAEARKEAAEVLRLNPNFSLEVHKQRMPIKDPAVLDRHIAALRRAGLK
jgi:TolB-like protein/DNA-binding winged helix-turn-helix (wHTH) protein/Tfp pilus assembly protein PilF